MSAAQLSLLYSLHKEDMGFQENPEEEEDPQTGIIGRFLGLQSHDHHPPRTNSKTKLLRPKKEGLLQEGQPKKLGSARQHPRNQEGGKPWKIEEEDDVFETAALYGRSGYHSAPQTPLSHTPMVFPPGKSAPSGLRRVSGTDSAVKDQSLQPVTPDRENSFELLSDGVGSSTENPQLGHVKKKTVEFNLTDMSETSEHHLRESHLDQSSNIEIILRSHGDPYWALEDRSVLYLSQVTSPPPLPTLPPTWGEAPPASLAVSLPFLPPCFLRFPHCQGMLDSHLALPWGTHLATSARALVKC